MKIIAAILILASSPLYSADEKDNSLTRFGDETTLLMQMFHFNAAKRASVLHKGERYHIYTGGKGSGIRYFNGFIFRESDKVFTLVAHIMPEPLDNGGVRSFTYLVPEIDTTGITFLARKTEMTLDKEFEVSRISFDDLRRIPKEGIQYLPSPYQSKQ